MSEPNRLHPDDETLDRLRAGLLDDDPQARARIEQHLAACAECRRRAGAWDRMHAALGLDRTDAPAIPAGRPVHRPRRHGLAAAAAVALVVGLGVFGGWYSGEDPPQNSEAAPPDLFAELDFYLWLIEEEGGTRSHEVGRP